VHTFLTDIYHFDHISVFLQIISEQISLILVLVHKTS